MDFASSCRVRVNLDADLAHTYRSLDTLTGQVHLALTKDTTVKSIVVKLEGISSTCFEISNGDRGNRRPRNRRHDRDDDRVSEEHKVLYQTVTVFPPHNIHESSQSGIFTLKAGNYTYKFQLVFPLNGDTPHSSSFPGAPNDALLPPSFSQMGRFANVNYFVKCTVKRSGIFSANARNKQDINFCPIEVSTPVDHDTRVWFVRRQVTIPLPDGKSSHYIPSTNPSNGINAWKDYQEKSQVKQPAATNSQKEGKWGEFKKQTENVAKVVETVPGGGIITAVGGRAYRMANGVYQTATQDWSPQSGSYKSYKGHHHHSRLPKPRKQSTQLKHSKSKSRRGSTSSDDSPIDPLTNGSDYFNGSDSGFNSITRGFKNMFGMNSWKGPTSEFFFELRGLAKDKIVLDRPIPFTFVVVFDTSQGHMAPMNYPVDAIYLTTLICTLHLTVHASAEKYQKNQRRKLDFFKARLDAPLLLSDAVQRSGNTSIWDLQISSELVRNVVVPDYVSPGFRTENIQTSYEIEIAASFATSQSAQEEFVAVTNPVVITSGKQAPNEQKPSSSSTSQPQPYTSSTEHSAGPPIGNEKHDMPPNYWEIDKS